MKFRIRAINPNTGERGWNSTTDDVDEDDVIDAITSEIRELKIYLLNGEYEITITPII